MGEPKTIRFDLVGADLTQPVLDRIVSEAQVAGGFVTFEIVNINTAHLPRLIADHGNVLAIVVALLERFENGGLFAPGEAIPIPDGCDLESFHAGIKAAEKRLFTL